jgi:hypothetical protein
MQRSRRAATLIHEESKKKTGDEAKKLIRRSASGVAHIARRPPAPSTIALAGLAATIDRDDFAPPKSVEGA